MPDSAAAGIDSVIKGESLCCAPSALGSIYGNSMGQNASKAAKAVVSKTRASGTNGPSSIASATGAGSAAASQGLPNHPPQPSPSPHQPSLSEEAAAAAYPSSSSRRDVAQQKFLKEKAGGSEYQEMPPDLLEFLKDAGPLEKKGVDSTATIKGATARAKERKLRLPRHLRDEPCIGDDDAQKGASPHPQPGSSSSIEATGERQIESMRLAENIPGFEVSRTTNFSSTPLAEENEDPFIFKEGEVLDIHDMIMLNRQRGERSEEDVVQEIYRQYAKKYAVPVEETEQEKHKDLLRSTISYLDVPVVMMDKDGEFDGVHPEQVKDLEFMGGVVVPKSKLKNVLEDFSDMRKRKEGPFSA